MGVYSCRLLCVAGGLKWGRSPPHDWAKCTWISLKNVFLGIINQKIHRKKLVSGLFPAVSVQNVRANESDGAPSGKFMQWNVQ
jgi:hypothetical protein